MDERPNSFAWRFVATLVAIAIIAGGTFAIGFATKGGNVNTLRDEVQESADALAGAQGTITEREEQLQRSQEQAAQLQALSSGLEAQVEEQATQIRRLEGTEDVVSGLEARVRSLTDQVSALESAEGAEVEVRDIADRLSVDRLLMAEMRKAPPQDRIEAQAFWAEVKRLAGQSDTSLSSKANKVTTALPAYFDWAERDFASTQESAITYILTGANVYDTSVEEFWGAFLLVVIDRIDALVVHTS